MNAGNLMINLFVLNEIQEAVRSAIIDSCSRVTDNGRETIDGKVRNLKNQIFTHFTLTIFDTFI